MDRFYSLTHSPIEFHFRQNPRDFVVDEIPLYEFSGDGEHLVLHIRKKKLSTWDMLELLASYLGIQSKEFGYAGLKDKNALTKQYISIHKKYEEKLEDFKHDNIKILSKTYHNNKIKMGHLKGNRFFIRLKKVSSVNAQKITTALESIAHFGMPNFFGYQRFGIHGDNYKKGEAILKDGAKEKNVKLKRMYVNAYQSHLFNLWLSRRLEMHSLLSSFGADEISDTLNMSTADVKKLQAQKHPFKLIDGDVMEHYPHGRLFHYESDEEDIERFENRQISPTGLLAGKKTTHATSLSHLIEKEFDEEINMDGARRYAWVFPDKVEGEYKENEAWFELHFSLPKGSYATVLIEEIAKQEIRAED
ncbi:MAG: tRNA pseudouridine(13) synthase TruD [Helicobacteraceae bacterium]|nr:tRNA pseudouridine(13) synthase TruD [Helicobacteraceae bacterium]